MKTVKNKIGEYTILFLLLFCQIIVPFKELNLNSCYAAEVNDIDLGEFQRTMKPEEKQLLCATVIPTDAENQEISYSSSDESVATINGIGRITAISEGSTTISATCGSVTRSFELTVGKEKVIKASEIDMGDYQTEMTEGDKQIIAATVFPSNVSDATIKYSSSNTKVATISSMGRISALKPGKTTISAKTNGASSSFELIVKEKIKAKEIDLGDYLETMKVKDKQMLGATVIPTNAVDQTITYSSSNEEVATINAIGRITAVAVGTTIIMTKCGAAENSFKLTVKEADIKYVMDIEIGNYEKEMYVDKTQTISATALPSTAENAAIKYTSSDTSVATVLSNGEVKAHKKGKVVITVKAGDVSKDIEITVKVATKKIELNSSYVVLKKGESFRLEAKAIPSDAVQELSYRVINSEVADVTKDGEVIAEDIGNTFLVVSNGDISRAVTVIVNKTGMLSREEEEIILKQENIALGALNDIEKELISGMELKNEISVQADKCSTVTKAVLKKLLETSSILSIEDEAYTLIIDGSKILNFENELSTGIDISNEENGLVFNLNRGKNMPGPVSIVLEKETVKGKYLYIYNDKKDKFLLLGEIKEQELKLDEAGKYLITDKKIQKYKFSIMAIVIAGGVCIILGIIYIALKKKYWFY